ncbi:hypothetical protein Pyn_03647 [Prunus yedoensis var. nudiflora]|uniref:Uncharacterized protein n=1 Tax=Prunus yedoensis var. nudiflora TaxID=2094558 RepID=A0A314ZAA1_PRUYE|nr:hypothetical protein Pyn_03647 [Prunus yedoensis var. nudiflora]
MMGEEEKSLRRRLLHLQGTAIIETVQSESSFPADTIRVDVPPLGDVASDEREEEPSALNPPPRSSGPGPLGVDKGNAPLVEEEEDEEEGGDLPLQRKHRAPSSPSLRDSANPKGGAGDKRARMDSFSSDEEELELDSMLVPQHQGKEKASKPIPAGGRSQKIHFLVRTIKLEEGVDLPPNEPQPASDEAVIKLSKTLQHIYVIKEILPYVRDPEEILEDHCDRKEGFAEAVEAAEDVLDKLEALEGEEVILRGEISANLRLKAELEAKMADIRARTAASEPIIQDLTSRTFRARLASKKLTSAW